MTFTGESAVITKPGVAALGGVRRTVRTVAAGVPGDRLAVALVLLLLGAWLSEGARGLVGLPHGVVGAVDVAEAAVCLWLGVVLVRERRIRLPLAFVLYLVWVLTGLIGAHAPTASVVTALKDSLLLPTLAVLVAMHATTERRAQILAGALFALCAFELVMTFAQSFWMRTPDDIVGSFGPSANAVTAAVILLTASLGFSAYMIRARYGRAALAAAAVLPLFSAWAMAKLTVFGVPAVALAVAVPALVLRVAGWRRAIICVLAALLSSGVAIASYAIFNPDSFDALTSTGLLQNYLVSASIDNSSAGGHGNLARGQPGHWTLLRMANEGISGRASTELFGHSTGSATVAVGLGGDRPQDLSRDAAAASYSDAGTALFERGWTGVCILAALALILATAALRIVRRLPRAGWTTAFSLAGPACLAIMTWYGLLAAQLQSRPAALTFWLIVGVGLSPILVRQTKRRPLLAHDGR